MQRSSVAVAVAVGAIAVDNRPDNAEAGPGGPASRYAWIRSAGVDYHLPSDGQPFSPAVEHVRLIADVVASLAIVNFEPLTDVLVRV